MWDLIARRCFLLCCWLVCVQQAQAADSDKPFTISGFGTLGAVYSDTGQVDIVRDLLQPKGVGYSNRLDFGVGDKSAVLSDMVNVSLSILAKKEN